MSSWNAALPRVFVLTDITSLSAGTREPDDGQSLIRLMLHANDLDVVGLGASSNLEHGDICRPELIHAVLDAYAADRPALLAHDPAFPPVERLRAGVVAGWPRAGRQVPAEECIGAGRCTDASRALIAAIEAPDPRPLWIAVWGGTADLAQALWWLREHRSATSLAAALAGVRVHAIYDQDRTAVWIKQEFPGLWYLTRDHGIRGMYRGGEVELVGPAWVETHVHGHGALGGLYPCYQGGDIFHATHGPVRGIKESDTPSWLGLLANGLNTPDRPDWGGWGGRCVEVAPHRFTDAADPSCSLPDDLDPRISATYRWRRDWQGEFAARLDWCVLPPGQGARHPVAHLRCPSHIHAAPGTSVTLDASDSCSRDGRDLACAWTLYAEAGTCNVLPVLRPNGWRLHLDLDPRSRGDLHVILTVRSAAGLCAYRRTVIRVA